MHIVRSNLKRDESSSSACNIEAQQQHGYHKIYAGNKQYNEALDQEMLTTTTMSKNNQDSSMELETITFTRTSGGGNTSKSWIFPPKAPSRNVYNCSNHDTIAIIGERNGFKGFKKQFSGRFKRLVSHKRDATSPIPPELKPQLKTIYVY